MVYNSGRGLLSTQETLGSILVTANRRDGECLRPLDGTKTRGLLEPTVASEGRGNLSS